MASGTSLTEVEDEEEAVAAATMVAKETTVEGTTVEGVAAE